MFTGIIEDMGRVTALEKEGTNLHIWLKSKLSPELKIDQSLAHNGVCLTVVEISGEEYRVTAIDETLSRSTLGQLKIGHQVNLERCTPLNGRLDGHIVQGHVDTRGLCTGIEAQNGSWIFTFEYEENPTHITVNKGSITVNGVSLTVAHSAKSHFSVAVIPYTFEHTVFKYLKTGHSVNLEFDIVGKYVARLLEMRKS